MPPIKPTEGLKKKTRPVQQTTKDGRPTMVFVDVGGKFLDVSDRDQRIKGATRRRDRKDSDPRESRRA
jgi:hypothetical protein